jgi:hypothetical protein
MANDIVFIVPGHSQAASPAALGLRGQVSASVRVGARRGAGRKKSGKVRKQVMLSAVVAEKIGRIAVRKKQSFSATVESACEALR